MPDDVDPVEWGYERVKQDLRESLSGIGVEFDTWFSERSLVESGAIEATLADLRSHGVVFEEDGATWLRTTDFGDDKARVLVKSAGEPTSPLPAFGYHRDQFADGHDQRINTGGPDHPG